MQGDEAEIDIHDGGGGDSGDGEDGHGSQPR